MCVGVLPVYMSVCLCSSCVQRSQTTGESTVSPETVSRHRVGVLGVETKSSRTMASALPAEPPLQHPSPTFSLNMSLKNCILQNPLKVSFKSKNETVTVT